MAWVPKKRAAIRDEYLADLGTRHVLAGKPLDTGEGSDEYRKAESLALISESQEVQAQNNTNEILPDKASEAGVARHGFVEGVDREEATKSVLQITVTGTALATVTFGSRLLTAPSGVGYVPSGNPDGTGSSVILDGGGSATAYAICQTTGTDGNLAVGSILAWSSTPTNANPTVTVASGGTPAQDQETKDSWALRIIEHRRERPASGNRAHWKEWAEAVDGVVVAFVYPLLHPTYGTNTRGSLTVILLGPAPGNSTTSRIVSGSVINNVGEYIEGTRDVHDNTVTNGTQLRPSSLPAGGYTLNTITETTQAVTIVLTMASNAPFPWSSPTSYTVSAYNSTTKVITLTADPAQVVAGNTIAVRDNSRGNYSYGVVASVDHILNTVTMESGFSPGTVDTTASGRIRPAPQSATAIRDAIFEYFDSLGPGDTTPACRWPTVDSDHPTVVYRSALAGAAIAASGGSVLSASVTTPGTDVTPAALAMIKLGELILSP